MTKPIENIFRQKSKQRLLSLVGFLVTFSIFSTLLLLISSAAPVPSSVVLEAESTQATQNASVVSDASASEGGYVEFNPLEDVPEIKEQWGGYTKPDASNTGHNGNLTRTFGRVNITQAWLDQNNGGSKVLENVRFTSQVDVSVDDLTIRNFEINANRALYGIYNQVFTGSPSKNLTLEDGEITDALNAGLVISNTVARRLHVHHQGADAFKPYRDVLIESSYAHHLGNQSATVHADGVQMVTGGRVEIRGNNFDMPHNEPGFTNSQVMIIQTDLASIDEVIIEYNWINGGGYSVQIRDKGNGFGPVTNAKLRYNRFGRDYQFGLLILHPGTGNEVYGNVWDDNGEAVL